jgi:FkbM family methyltransferase
MKNSVLDYFFKYHFFTLYLYHPTLFVLNLFRYRELSFRILKDLYKKDRFYNLFGFKINSPSRLNKHFFANINTHFNCFALNNYELSEKYLIEKYIDKTDHILELGGCLGVISLISNNLLINKSNHVVFEIDELKFNYLKINKNKNNANFNIINGAISDNPKMYYRPSYNFWGGEITASEVNAKRIKTNNIKEIEYKFKIKFNTLIMDIEGGEIEIFENQNLNHFEKIIFENHFTNDKDQNAKIVKLLTTIGFKSIESKGKVEIWKK